MGDLSQHFSLAELTCPCCDQAIVNPHLLWALEDIREQFGKPVFINSGNRCKAHNDAVGGSANSQHLTGKAADFYIDGISTKAIYDYLNNKYPNMYGIGYYNRFIHLDVRIDKARW